MSKQETTKVTLDLPTRLVHFLKNMENVMNMTVKDYCENAIIQTVGADLDSWETFSPNPQSIMEEYGLKAILKEHNALPYMDP